MTRRFHPVLVDLILDNGELVRIGCPGQHEDEFMDSINNAIKMADEWSPRQFENCSATYRGIYLERVNMARVVGRA